MIKYYITKEDLYNLHKMALKANKNKSYRDGYLDSYNRFKIFLNEESDESLVRRNYMNGSEGRNGW